MRVDLEAGTITLVDANGELAGTNNLSGANEELAGNSVSVVEDVTENTELDVVLVDNDTAYGNSGVSNDTEPIAVENDQAVLTISLDTGYEFYVTLGVTGLFPNMTILYALTTKRWEASRYQTVRL